MENNISFYSVLKNSSTCAKFAAKAYPSLSNKSSTLANRRGGTPAIQSGCFPPLPDKVRVVCVPPKVQLAFQALTENEGWKLRPLVSCSNPGFRHWVRKAFTNGSLCLKRGLCQRWMLKCFCGSNCYGYQMLPWSGGGGKWKRETVTIANTVKITSRNVFFSRRKFASWSSL